MIITRTPMRISMGGGGTDLPFYYTKHGGSLVTAAIDKYVYITTNKRFEDKIRLSYSKTEITNDIDKIQNDRAREALRLLGIHRGAEITTVADVPARSGLGGSGSFLVGLLNSLHRHKREYVSKQKLAEEACKIEMDILKYPMGKQDQYIASFGGILHLKIDKRGNVRVSPINISEESILELERNIFLFYTGILRDSSKILKSQKTEAERNKKKMEYMHQIKKIGERSKRALESGDVDRFGRLLNVHWETKRSLTDKMSNPQINKWYELAIKNGAFGGKIIGAGGGGFFMLYCKNNQDRFKKAMMRAGLIQVPFRFDFDGSKILVDTG